MRIKLPCLALPETYDAVSRKATMKFDTKQGTANLQFPWYNADHLVQATVCLTFFTSIYLEETNSQLWEHISVCAGSIC